MEQKYKNFYEILFKLRMEYYRTAASEAVRNDLQLNGYMRIEGVYHNLKDNKI